MVQAKRRFTQFLDLSLVCILGSYNFVELGLRNKDFLVLTCPAEAFDSTQTYSFVRQRHVSQRPEGLILSSGCLVGALLRGPTVLQLSFLHQYLLGALGLLNGMLELPITWHSTKTLSYLHPELQVEATVPKPYIHSVFLSLFSQAKFITYSFNYFSTYLSPSLSLCNNGGIYKQLISTIYVHY